ncbi:MAG: flagellar hook-associated protein FlgK [Gammaproteobacteria bacterium]|nr:flagellar hook-associated protein FlgK [Gammaproteobacteria bacterium]MDH5800532.1 flagellar hook-associated protein FlgK [Gammaproteobacteria bacterium]
MLNTAVSGLLAFQRALDVTSHNISNATTEGYSRQRVNLATREPERAANGFIGKGVQVTGVDRVYDQFLLNQLNTRTANYGQSDTYAQIASQVESVFADPSIGLSPALDRFFNSIHGVSNDPTSTPARQVMISEAENLVETFHTLNRQVEQIKSGVNSQVGVVVTQVNDLAASIASLNEQIVLQTGAAGGQPPNDLLDKRDLLIHELSEITNVTTVAQENGAVNVYVGTGQSLVLNVSAGRLQVSNGEFDPLNKRISLVTPSGSVPITEQLTGGKLGGLLSVKDDLLEPAQMELGRIAASLANVFNSQHVLGEGLNGSTGLNFFTPVDQTAVAALPSSDNNPASGNMTVTINAIGELKASDYRVNFDGTNYSVLRLSDDTLVDSFTSADLPRAVSGEGFTLDMAGGINSGDSFLVRPTRYAAEQIGMAVTDPASIAAAQVGNNVGDNSNALLMAGVRTSTFMDNGTSTVMDAYGNSVARIGVKTGQAKINASAQKALMDQAYDAKESVSGVNLDEEAVNLLRYQQAYQAAAQVISVVDSLFQTLLNSVNR